ncbi:hypothetical protein, variant [Verruconis gallopava]|uniref:Uncharacterized protein n=1 Tax=Verruconis gallopava TaxID=253628 RepID=A0A0D1XLB4_9PEZI|nr:uncharacterized protein PV09_05432 [Verruconis gallopava]XP_016213076.1 hypothetical protein, variant [Verruconis gallopava]KIW03206.1 hypothetical protein PV09_05432 [Verruconis gallopava]KIW03207.1 hypothetical protein, variant [Verruconis gallopava]
MSGSVAKKQDQQLDRHVGQSQRMRQVDEREVEAKGSASAGLNLNLAAVVSGLFTGKKKTTTETDPDGSSHSVEHSKGRGYVDGSGVMNINAIGSADSTVTERQRRTIEGSQEQIDHLGLNRHQAIEAAQK